MQIRFERITSKLIEETECDVFIVNGEDYRGASMINSLCHLNLVKLIKNVIGVANEMLVHKVHKLVFGRVLKLVVALGLAVSDEVLSIEIIQIDFDLASHPFASHSLSSIAEEVEILNSTDRLEALHDALANDIPLLGVSQNADSFVQVSIACAEMSLNSSAQHLYLICNLIIIL